MRKLLLLFNSILAISVLSFGANAQDVSVSMSPRSESVLVTDLSPNATVDEIIAHAQRYADMGMFAEQSQVLENLIKSDKPITLRQESQALYALAHSYYGQAIYQRSLTYLYQLLRIEPNEETVFYRCASSILLSDIFIRFGNPHKATQMVERAEKTLDTAKLPKSKHDDLQQRIYQQWSTIHAFQKKWPEFLRDIQKSDSIGLATDYDKNRRLLDYGIYYMQTGDYKLATHYFKKLIDYPGWSYDKMAAVCDYAHMLSITGDMKGAGEMADTGLELLQGHEMEEMRSTLLRIKALSLNDAGRSEEAVKLLEKSRQINDSILYWHSAHSIFEAATDYEKEQDANEHLRLINDRKKMTRYVIILVIIILLSATFILWGWRRSKRLKSDIDKLNGQLSKVNEVHDNKMSVAQEDLSKNQRRLMSLSIKMARLSELVNEAIEPDDRSLDADSRLEMLKSEIKASGINRNVWEIFDILCEQTNPEFFTKLSIAHPDLTKGEKRMCAYLLMNLTTKEIAVITNRSTRTVETVKYRLNKKLSPPDGVSTTDYLRGLRD